MKVNHITPLPADEFAQQIIADKNRPAWNFAHLARQNTALRDAGQENTATAMYIRRAMTAILQGNDERYLAALDEIIKLAAR